MKENKKRALKALKAEHQKVLEQNEAYKEIYGGIPPEQIGDFNPQHDLIQTTLKAIQNCKLPLIAHLQNLERAFLLDRAGEMDEIEKEDHIHYLKCLNTIIYNA